MTVMQQNYLIKIRVCKISDLQTLLILQTWAESENFTQICYRYRQFFLNLFVVAITKTGTRYFSLNVLNHYQYSKH